MVAPICPRKLDGSSQLIQNLLIKKKLLETGNPSHREIKTALVLQGGVFLGSYGGGVAWGLEDVGLGDAFDYVIGVSTGSVTGAYFLSQQMSVGAPIFYEDLVDGRFLNFRRTKQMIDMDYLIDIFKLKKSLDIERIADSRSKLLIPVTDMETGEAEVFSMEESGVDTFSLLKAAMSLPGLHNSRTEINGRVYCDGIYGFTNPVSYAVEELGCTDIVVVTNRACSFISDPKHLSYIEMLSANTLLRNLTPEFRKVYMSRRSNNGPDLELMWGQESKANIGLICRDIMPIGRFSQDGDKIREVIVEAREQVAELFRF